MLFSKRYKESKTIGSILLISGTTVGAGMLAMPLTAMGVGYLLSFVLLVIMWFVMYSAAILQSELFKNEPIGISFATLVERVIGKRYKIIPAIMKSLLFFGLLSAYMTAASSVMVQLFNIPFFTSSVLFSLFLGMVIYKETQKMDHINRIFVVLKFSLFFIVMVILFNQINFSNFPVFESSSDVNFLILSIPMFFTSFGFHGSIPNIVEFLKDDQRALKKVFFIGSIIPLMVYILWITATFGSAYSCGQLKITQNTDLGTFLSHISACTSHPTLVNGLLQWFSFLSFITSFIGVGVGQINYMQEIVNQKLPAWMINQSRLLACFLTIGVPFVFSVFYPNGFILALAFAGLWLCVLALVLPGIMAFVKKDLSPSSKIRAILCLFFGMGLIVMQIFIKIAF